MREVFWSLNALEDLDSIVLYIATDNPRAALNVVEKIEATGNALGDMSTGRRGRVGDTYERVVVGLPYTIAYAVEPRPGGTERIVILRVIHQARDWPKGEWPKG